MPYPGSGSGKKGSKRGAVGENAWLEKNYRLPRSWGKMPRSWGIGDAGRQFGKGGTSSWTGGVHLMGAQFIGGASMNRFLECRGKSKTTLVERAAEKGERKYFQLSNQTMLDRGKCHKS